MWRAHAMPPYDARYAACVCHRRRVGGKPRAQVLPLRVAAAAAAWDLSLIGLRTDRRFVPGIYYE